MCWTSCEWKFGVKYFINFLLVGKNVKLLISLLKNHFWQIEMKVGVGVFLHKSVQIPLLNFDLFSLTIFEEFRKMLIVDTFWLCRYNITQNRGQYIRQSLKKIREPTEVSSQSAKNYGLAFCQKKKHELRSSLCPIIYIKTTEFLNMNIGKL